MENEQRGTHSFLSRVHIGSFEKFSRLGLYFYPTTAVAVHKGFDIFLKKEAEGEGAKVNSRIGLFAAIYAGAVATDLAVNCGIVWWATQFDNLLAGVAVGIGARTGATILTFAPTVKFKRNK